MIASSLAATAILATTGCKHEYEPVSARDADRTWKLGGTEITIEVAKDQEKRQLGLKHREAMPENHGMLFVYPEPRVLRFWMKHSSLPLSIAFLEELPEGKARIINLEDMKPFDESGIVSLGISRHALEMNQGWFAKHGLKAGDTVEFPKWVTDIVASEDT